MSRTHTTAVVVMVLALTAVGCVGVQTDTPTPRPETGTSTATPQSIASTATPLSSGDIDFPNGPEEPPERPAVLSESSVREYVRVFEYRLAYNSLWINEYTEVTLACRVDDVSERPWGYEAVVTCTGYSNTGVPENATTAEETTPTPGPHADWFTQSFRYRVSEDVMRRDRTDSRDPVS